MDINQLLLYSGFVMAAAAVIFAVIMLVILHIKKIKLNYKFDEEYGKQQSIENITDK